MYMLDTNVCVFVLKNRSETIRRKFRVVKNLCISSVTYGELCFGIENSELSARKRRWQQLADFTQRLIIESWDEEAAKHYGVIRAHLKRSGNTIGNNDLLIAAHARSTSSILVTNNTREFTRVPDLTIEDWLQ